MASAYRNIAVHLQDRYLLEMKWHDSFFVDLALPFGPSLGSVYLHGGCGYGGVDVG